MKKHTSLNKSYLSMIGFLVFCCLTGCTVPTQERINVNIENKGLVEIYISSQTARDKTNFLLNILEAEDPTLTCISYDQFGDHTGYPSYTSHPYGYMHYLKVEPCLNIQIEGLPRTVYQRQSSSVGMPDVFWIADTQRSMKQKIVEKKIESVSFQLSCNDENSYQVSASLKWIESMTQEELEGLRYNLFLKPDKLYLLNEYGKHLFADNIAYDFTLLSPVLVKIGMKRS
jgi:hypothetical protein